MGLHLRDVSHRKTQKAGVGLTTSGVGSYRTSCSLCIYKWLCRFSYLSRTIDYRKQVLRMFSKSPEVVVWEGKEAVLGNTYGPRSQEGLLSLLQVKYSRSHLHSSFPVSIVSPPLP